jgi:hypothetical protein
LFVFVGGARVLGGAAGAEVARLREAWVDACAENARVAVDARAEVKRLTILLSSARTAGNLYLSTLADGTPEFAAAEAMQNAIIAAQAETGGEDA